MSPTITVASFFFFFFVRPQNVCVVDTFYRTTKSTEPASGITSELLQRVPPFVYSIFNLRFKTGRDYRVPPLNFFGTVRLFFRIFFCRQTVLPSSFLIFCSKLKFQKAQRVPLSSFRHCETVSKFSFFVFLNFFQKIFKVFFCRQTVPPSSFFDILQQTEVSKSPKGSSLSSFRHCETVSKFSFFVFSKVFSKKFPNFFIVSFNFFDILQQTGFSKS